MIRCNISCRFSWIIDKDGTSTYSIQVQVGLQVHRLAISDANEIKQDSWKLVSVVIHTWQCHMLNTAITSVAFYKYKRRQSFVSHYGTVHRMSSPPWLNTLSAEALWVHQSSRCTCICTWSSSTKYYISDNWLRWGCRTSSLLVTLGPQWSQAKVAKKWRANQTAHFDCVIRLMFFFVIFLELYFFVIHKLICSNCQMLTLLYNVCC